jgi:TPR repeat protein
MSIPEFSSLPTPRSSTKDAAPGEDLYQQALSCEATGDFAKAAELFNAARRMKHGKSCARLGFMLIDGRPGVKANEAEAFACASEGSELGCADSKGTLSRCYLGGRGVSKDPKKALALSLESVRAGSQFGQVTLGGMHQFGEVVWHTCSARLLLCARMQAM